MFFDVDQKLKDDCTAEKS